MISIQFSPKKSYQKNMTWQKEGDSPHSPVATCQISVLLRTFLSKIAIFSI